MPNRNLQSDYRYGYQGEFAETDPETGKPAFELRLYDPRINRWLTPDPYGQYNSPYVGMGNDWVNGVDPDGGYKTWFGAVAGWIGGGFKGSIFKSDDAATPLHKYGINKTGDGSNGILVDFGNIKQDLLDNGYYWQNDGQGEIQFHPVFKAHQNTIFEDVRDFGVENNIPFTETTYNIADDVSVFVTSFDLINPVGQPLHLDGSVSIRGSEDHINAGLNGYMTILPLPKFNIRGINIAQSNKFFKGTKYNKLAPKTKGAILRAFNYLLKKNVTPKKIFKQTKSKLESFTN